MQISGATTTQAGAGVNRFSELSSEQFIQIMIQELQNQDPLQPQDSSALLEQLSSIRNIESQMTLQEELSDLVLQNQVASAGNLIGRYVEGLAGDNNRIGGVVTSVRVADGNVMLELDTGLTLSMDRVAKITELPASEGGV